MSSTNTLVTESVTDLSASVDNIAGDKKEPETATDSNVVLPAGGFRALDFKSKVHYARDVMTVEPLLAAYIIAAYISLAALGTLEFAKACLVNAGYNETVCTLIITGDHETVTSQNNHVQGIISDVHSWQIPLQSVVPIVVVLFLGSYSDRNRIRKPFLLLPLLGEFVGLIGCILCVVYMKTWSLEIQGVFQVVVPSFFGSIYMLTMAAFSYIADVSTVEMRTLRIGVVQVVLTCCAPLAQYLSTVLFQKFGYIPTLSISAVIHLLGILYGIFWIKEPKKPVPISKEIILDMFNPKYALETINLMFKKTSQTSRLLLLIVLAIFFLNIGVLTAESSLLVLFTQKKFSWTPVDTIYYAMCSTILIGIGTSIFLTLSNKYFKFTDITIIIIAFIDKIVLCTINVLATNGIQFIIGMVIGMLAGVANVAMRSVATKVVLETDLGKAQSLISICEAVAASVAIPLYNLLIYKNTIDHFPGAFFLPGIGLYILCIVLTCCIPIIQKRNLPKETNGEMKNKKQSAVDDSIVQSTYL